MRMHKVLISALLLGAAAAASAQPAAVTVRLSNFSFNPNTIRLKAGAPATLRIQNASRGGHNFSAPEFFAAARIDPKSAAFVRKGAVEVPGGRTVDVTLVPSAGTYRLKCTHTLHSTFGMKGMIFVE
jgi:plastocyanin